MIDTSTNNKRIAKNTIFLYIRMILVMLVTLYTSRVILQVLGVEDFGIYNVVAGVVSMFSFLNGSLSGASSRFITYALGEGCFEKLQKTFNSIVTIHYIIAIIILILAETVGLWFVMNKLVIPEDRVVAAIWVYQSAILSAIILLVSTPFNALIIAHEKMNAFAYISIVEAVLKLLIVFALYVISYDHLIIFAVLTFFVQVLIRMLYSVYCRKNFKESHYKIEYNKEQFKSILGYTGWTINGHLAIVGFTQGLNILLNLFLGPVVNAAYAIATQVQMAARQLYGNFMTAIKPQVIKSYASGELHYMHQLILSSARYSFYMTLLVSMPLFFQTEFVLKLWLGQVPEYSVVFVRLFLITAMNYTLSTSTLMGIHATGDIRKFQIIEGSMLLTVVPIAYLLLKFAQIPAYGVLIVYLIIETITQFVRVWIVYPRIELSIYRYFTEVLWPIVKVSIFVWVLPFICEFLTRSLTAWTSFIMTLISCLVSVCLCVIFLGVKQQERIVIWQKLKEIIKK